MHLLQLWHLILLALFFGTVRGFFSPAYQSIIPQLVGKGDLASANSLTELSYQFYCSLGPMLGASCVAFAGPAAAFAFDGLTFLVSALCLITQRLPVPLCPATMASAQLPRQGIRTAVSEMREGLRYVAGSTFLWVTIALAALFTVGGAGSLVVALPKLVHDVYGQGVWLLGSCPCRWWHRLTCRYSPRGASESFAQARDHHVPDDDWHEHGLHPVWTALTSRS